DGGEFVSERRLRRGACRLADKDNARYRRAQGDENVYGEAHARGVDAHLGRGDGIAADGVDVMAKARAVENKSERGGDDEENDRWIGYAEARGGVGGDVDEPAHDRHRPERRDEGIDSEIGDEPPVCRANEKTSR